MSFESLTRNVHAILSFYNEKSELVDISRAVSSISLKEITCSDDTLKMGEFCKNCLEFEYYQEFVDENIAWNNKRVKLSFTEGNTEEEKAKNTVDVGIFYVQAKDVETSNNGKSYKVTSYDLPSVMSETFDTTKTSSSVTDIVKYIGSISGMYFKDGTTFGLDKIESVDEELTNIGMLAYIVGYDGKNIRTTADGKLETYWYYSNTDSSHFKGTISRDVQLLNEFTNKEVVSPLSAITSGYTISDDDSSTVISVGSGVAMTYTNPYITKEQLQSVLDRVKGFDYSVGSVKFRGNPTYRCGDTVQVETTQGEYVLFPIMEQTITYDGGMVATISSYTYETENTVMGATSPTERKLEQVYTGLTASFQKQTGLINTNLKGGYYRLLQDADTKYPYGWLIADSEEITDSTKGWRWTQGGLAYSEDGFKTASKIAITMDGQISADMITVGSMDGGLIKANTIQVEQLSEDVQTELNSGVSSVTSQYYQSTSSTTQTGGSWSDTQPTWKDGTYIWFRTKMTAKDGTVTYGTASCITGNTGKDGSAGAKGDKGDTGATGNGIKSTVTTYQASASGTTTPTGTWSSTPPSTSADKPYLWTKVVVTYTNSTTSTFYSIGSTIEGVSVGGRNLLRNSNFANGVTNWVADIGTDAVVNDDELGQAYKTNLTGGTGRVYQITSNLWKADQIYSYSFYAKADSEQTIRAGRSFVDVSPTTHSLTTSWVRYTGIIKCTATIDGGTYTLALGKKNVDTYIANVKLEIGNQATDWTPAPEDTDEKITNAQSTASSALNTAENNASKISNITYEVDSNGEQIAVLTSDFKSTQETAQNAYQQSIEATKLANANSTSISNLEQVVVADSTGVKVMEAKDATNYSQIQADGLHVVVGNDDVAQFGQESKMNNLAVKSYLMFGAHRAEKFTHSSEAGTAFYWIGEIK